MPTQPLGLPRTASQIASILYKPPGPRHVAIATDDRGLNVSRYHFYSHFRYIQATHTHTNP